MAKKKKIQDYTQEELNALNHKICRGIQEDFVKAGMAPQSALDRFGFDGVEVEPKEKVQVAVEFDKDYIEGLMTDVGLYVGYWAEAPVGNPKFPMTISEFGDDGLGKKHTVTSEDVVRGVTIVANNYPRLWGYICDQNPDSDVADVVLQCAIFGKPKYG